MADDPSAYAALGLEPGAEPDEIEQAYKRLIKEHHPDRAGGDARRAAEINRAYRELRSEWNLKAPLELNEDWDRNPATSGGWRVGALIIGAAAAAAIIVGSPIGTPGGAPRLSSKPSISNGQIQAAHTDPMDQPLHLGEIARSARHAQLLARTRDEMALASESRECHHALRREPSLVQLDRCAAFDDAVVQLQDRDPLRDQGPFGELAVTGRLWSGASALSEDYVAIDGRLDRIRLQVELALSPPPSAPPVIQKN